MNGKRYKFRSSLKEKKMKTLITLVLSITLTSAFAHSDMLYIDKDFSRGNIDPVHQGHNQIILTFDDGPNPGITEKFLDILQDYGIKATFFVIGNNAKKYPDIMNRMVSEGHIVGNHSMTHTPLKNLDPLIWKTIVQSEVMNAHETLMPYMLNNKRYYYRAPAASWATKFADLLNQIPIGREYAGPVLWDIGGEIEIVNGKYRQAADWACWSKKISVDDCMSGYMYEAKKYKGGVVLMHDLRTQSAEMLAKLIPSLENEGFTFKTMDDVEF